MWYSNEIIYDVIGYAQVFNILSNREYLSDSWVKSLEILHVDTDRQPEEKCSRCIDDIVMV